MRCFVCGKTLREGEDCPVCGFRFAFGMGDASKEEIMGALGGEIADHKKSFLERLNFGVTAYRWKDENGKLVSNGRDFKPIATGTELAEGEKWLDETFARIPDQREITVSLLVTLDGVEQPKMDVSVPNPPEKELQQVGLRLTDDMKVIVMLRNSQRTETSEPEAIFD